jgi:hypothetical protein
VRISEGWPRTNKTEITGAEQQAIKRAVASRGVWGQEKKSAVFFTGEVFFLLTSPLMGDPISPDPPAKKVKNLVALEKSSR